MTGSIREVINMQWLANNLSTIIIALVVAGAIAAIIVAMIRSKKKGKTSCGCGCDGCPMSGSCHDR